MANVTIPDLTEETTPVGGDEVELAKGVGGASRRSSFTNVTKALDGAQIKTLYEANADTNEFSDAEQTKLAGIETSADVTDATNVAAAGALMDSDDTVDLNNLSATGTATSATFLRGDNSWATPVGSGDVSKVGTPVDNQVGVWTGDGTIEGDADLTWDGSTLDAAAVQARAVLVNAETAPFTFALDDAGQWTTFSNASPGAATIPPNSSVAFPVGTILTLVQIGAGECTWTPGAAVTLNVSAAQSFVTNGQYSLSMARKTATDTWEVYGNLAGNNPIEAWVIPISDQSTDLTTGTAKFTFRAPYAFTLTDIQASVSTAPVGATLIIDVNDGGTSIMTTNKLVIDASEETTATAATPPTLTDTSIAEDAEITFDIDQVGSSTAGQGAVVKMIGYRT